jgi:hypothetical protein
LSDILFAAYPVPATTQFELSDWGRQLQDACVSIVKGTYETLREVVSRGELEEHFGRAFVQQLEVQVLQRQQLLRSLSIRGQVVEHPVPAAAAEATEKGAEHSVSGEQQMGISAVANLYAQQHRAVARGSARSMW